MAVEERRVRIVRTTKTHRGRRYRDYYVKIHLPEYIAEKVDHYLARIDTETGRITLEPILRKKHGGGEKLVGES